MRFVLPHSPDDRPAWLIRLGLFLYDNLGGRKQLPGTRVLNLLKDPEGDPIKDAFSKGFEYSDCWVDDARLVVLNALDAKEKGAEVLTRTACSRARREGDHWDIEMTDVGTGAKRSVRAKVLVNAAGPWVNDIIGRVAGSNSTRGVRLVKGSHIIVPKFWDGPQAYLVQNTDKRVIFINPYEGDKALIGTTDIPYDGMPESVEIDEDEVAYLIAAVNRYFNSQLSRDDVLETFSGVRPLYDDKSENPSAVTRDYIFDLDETGGAPMLSVFGGKITTYRKLGEHAMDKLKPFFADLRGAWTDRSPLPGGDLPEADFEKFLDSLRDAYPWLREDLARHYARLYGSRATAILGSADGEAGLGRRWGNQLFEAEVDYLREFEWARAAEDVLDRRTKHGLHMTAGERDEFRQWFENGLAQTA